MTLVNIDLRNQGYETGPDGRVIFYSLLVSEGDFGTISTAPVEVRLTDGKATIDLAPGPVGVQIIAGQVADTRVKIGEVPARGPTTLNAVMMVTPAYTPALQAMMIAAIERAKEVAVGQVDAEVVKAVDAEVGEFKTKAEQALTKSTAAESKSDTALSKSATAESSASNAVSRVEALEVVGGFAPGVPADGQTANFIAQPDTLTRKALDSSYVTHIPTATQLNSMTFPVGAVVRTNGFHSLGDGGACTYLTIPSAEKSYDLPGIECAYRPQNESGVISPKQFGTHNNGSDFDNFPLQACYDFSADTGIGRIDGQGLTYTIGTENPYEEPLRGWAHTGAIMKSGRILSNATFRTANGATNGTVPFSVDMLNDGKPTYIRDCTFDGNRLSVNVPTPSGREDGGAHLVHLYNRPALATPIAERDFEPTADVFFDNCHFKDAFSYGVRLEYMDALVKFTDCRWDVYGIAVQMHATKVVVDGAVVNTHPGVTGRVGNPFHEEIEFSGYYTGSKVQTIELRNIEYTSGRASGVALFKIHYGKMQGVHWKSINIDNCHTRGNEPTLLDISASEAEIYPVKDNHRMAIDTISIMRSTSSGELMARIHNSPEYQVSVNNLITDSIAGHNKISATRFDIQRLDIQDPTFSPELEPIALNNCYVNLLKISNTSGELGVNGFLRSFTSTVDRLEIEGGEITQGGAVTVECAFGEAVVRSLKVHSPDSGARRFFYPRSAKSQITFQDVLFTSTEPTGPLVHGTIMTDGWVLMRNTRHISGATPSTSVSALPEGRIIAEDVTPLISPMP